MKWMRCLADDIAVTAARSEYGRRMGRGVVVDFDEVIAPARNGGQAFTLGDALAGRQDCFEPVEPETPAAMPTLAEE